MRPAERGAALLTVLMLVAVMAVLATSALEQLKLSTRMSANANALDQARALSGAGETLALLRVTDLVRRDSQQFLLAGGWQGRNFTLPLPGGAAIGRLRDGGNCFNLNSVATGTLSTDLRANPVGVAQFVALMRLVGIDQPSSARVAASLADWLDADAVPAPGGAEDDYYRSLASPYRAANARIEDVSELRAVAGVTPQIYERLRPWICALPETTLSPININTLSPDAAVLLAMLLPGRIDVNQARNILAQRPPGGYAGADRFWAQPALQALQPDQTAMTQTKVTTRWFALDMTISYAGTALTETGLIDGGLSPARLVRRQWGDAD